MEDRFLYGLQKMIVDGVVDGITVEIHKILNSKVNESQKRFMNIGEVCEYLGKSRPTIKRWMSDGLVFSMPEGKHYVFDVEDVVDYIKSNKIR